MFTKKLLVLKKKEKPKNCMKKDQKIIIVKLQMVDEHLYKML